MPTTARRYFILFCAGAIATIGSTVAIATPLFFEVSAGGAYLNRFGSISFVRRPDRLYERDRLETGRQKLCFLIDYRAGEICGRAYSQLWIDRIRRDSKGCIDERLRFDGELDLNIKPLTCPSSRIFFVAPNGSVFLISGTKTEITSDGEDSRVLVFTGEVVIRQNKARVVVPHGFGALVEGQNPPKLFKIDYNKTLKYEIRHGALHGEVNPFNQVEVFGNLIKTDMGKFSIQIDRLIPLTIIDPLGNRRTYQIDPRKKSGYKFTGYTGSAGNSTLLKYFDTNGPTSADVGDRN